MSSKRAVQLCPKAIFVKPRFHVYKEVSHQIREIFARYTDLIEPLSLDEAYLDVTVDKEGVFTIIGTAEVLEILGKYVKSTPTMADDMALAILKRIIASWE